MQEKWSTPLASVWASVCWKPKENCSRQRKADRYPLGTTKVSISACRDERIQAIRGPSVFFQSLGKLWNKSLLGAITSQMKHMIGKDNTDSPRANRAWQTWPPHATKQPAQWMWVRNGHHLPGLPQSFWCCFPQSLPKKADVLCLGQVVPVVGGKLTHWSHPEGGDKQLLFQLAICHIWMLTPLA